VPPDWNLGALGGEFKKGYLRLDDLDRPRLEVKWNEQDADIDRALEKYLKSIGRPRRNEPAAEEITEEKFLSSRAKSKKRLRGFSWKSGPDLQGAGVIWYCQECGRTLFGQLRAYGKENAVALAKEVFGSMDDHARKGRHLWAVYGLECELPEEYHLTGQSLMAGFIELSLQGKGNSRLRIARWGLAANMLQDSDLQGWLQAKGVKPKSELRWEGRDTIVMDHAGLETWGNSRRPIKRLYAGLRRLGRASLGREPLEVEARADGLGRVWHCPESNRVYLAESINRPDKELLCEIVDSIRCH
jgi:hypothetical protein